MVQVTYNPTETFPQLLNSNNPSQNATFTGVDISLANSAFMRIRLYDVEPQDLAYYSIGAYDGYVPVTGDKTTKTFDTPIGLEYLVNGTNRIIFTVNSGWGYRIESVYLVVDSSEAPVPEVGIQGFAMNKLSTINYWIDTRLKVVDTGETVSAVPSGYTRILLGTFSSLDVYLEFKFYTW